GKFNTAELSRAIEAIGYRVLGVASNYQQAEALVLKAEEDELRDLWLKLALGSALWLAVMLEHPLGFSIYTAWGFATVVQLWCGSHFHRGFWSSLLSRRADMNTLVSLSTWAAYLFSTWVIFWPSSVHAVAHAHLLEASTGLIVVVTLGRWIEVRLRRRSRRALARLLRLTPNTARVLRDGGEEVVPLAEIAVGEKVRVGPGEQVSLDGVVEEGHSTVDESLLTGESEPVEKSPGAHVFGGTMNKVGEMT